MLLTIPSLTIQWKLDCWSHKPLDGVKTGITVGCFFRFCMRRRQSCFRRVISIGVLPATPTPSPVKISLYRSSVTSRYDLWPSRSGFCDPEQKKHNKMESTFFHKLSTNRNVRWTILFVASQESQGKVPGFPDSTRDWNRQRRPVSRL